MPLRRRQWSADRLGTDIDQSRSYTDRAYVNLNTICMNNIPGVLSPSRSRCQETKEAAKQTMKSHVMKSVIAETKPERHTHPGSTFSNIPSTSRVHPQASILVVRWRDHFL